jgi:Protein of unknown function (DUF3147)
VSEAPFTQAPREAIGVESDPLGQVRGRDLLIRFLFGAMTSAVAAVVTIAFGPRAGGLFLAFPAILAATVTLIEDEDSAGEAREDARGAVVGAVALSAFAAICAALFGHIPGGLVLAGATAAWCALAVGLYLLLWHRSGAR